MGFGGGGGKTELTAEQKKSVDPNFLAPEDRPKPKPVNAPGSAPLLEPVADDQFKRGRLG